MAEVAEVNDNNFEQEVLKAETPVLVDFWAEWCRPCLQLAPVIKQLADEYAGQVKVVKLNIDESQRVAGTFRIQSIPTVLAFKDGQVVGQVIGARPKASFKDMIDKLV